MEKEKRFFARRIAQEKRG